MLRVAQVKVYPVKGDLEANTRQLMQVLAALADQQPDVVVTPEGYLDGYVATEDYVTKENIGRYAVDPHSSPYVEAVASWARANRAWVILGCARHVPDGVSNSAVILDRAGEVAGTYDKVRLHGHDLKYVAGSSLPVFQSDFGPFGVMICADRRWPETVRTLALRGARIIFNPTYGNHSELNTCMMRTRAYESEVFIAFTHPAHALFTGPKGEIFVEETSPAKEFTVTDVDLAYVDAIRGRVNSRLNDRRPELYER